MHFSQIVWYPCFIEDGKICAWLFCLDVLQSFKLILGIVKKQSILIHYRTYLRLGFRFPFPTCQCHNVCQRSLLRLEDIKPFLAQLGLLVPLHDFWWLILVSPLFDFCKRKQFHYESILFFKVFLILQFLVKRFSTHHFIQTKEKLRKCARLIE
jgi:hypothetical protein